MSNSDLVLKSLFHTFPSFTTTNSLQNCKMDCHSKKMYSKPRIFHFFHSILTFLYNSLGRHYSGVFVLHQARKWNVVKCNCLDSCLSRVTTYPVVSSLVFVIDPVEFFIRAVLNTVLSDPLLCITAALTEDSRHHHHLLQVYLQPLTGVLKLGQPGTSGGEPQVDQTCVSLLH